MKRCDNCIEELDKCICHSPKVGHKLILQGRKLDEVFQHVQVELDALTIAIEKFYKEAESILELPKHLSELSLKEKFTLAHQAIKVYKLLEDTCNRY